jgi:hypothetical protein
MLAGGSKIQQSENDADEVMLLTLARATMAGGHGRSKGVEQKENET